MEYTINFILLLGFIGAAVINYETKVLGVGGKSTTTQRFSDECGVFRLYKKSLTTIMDASLDAARKAMIAKRFGGCTSGASTGGEGTARRKKKGSSKAGGK